MSGNEIENHLALIIALAELGKSEVIPLLGHTYPHVMDAPERSDWKKRLMLADLQLQEARQHITKLLAAPVLQEKS